MFNFAKKILMANYISYNMANGWSLSKILRMTIDKTLIFLTLSQAGSKSKEIPKEWFYVMYNY